MEIFLRSFLELTIEILLDNTPVELLSEMMFDLFE